VRPAWVQAVLGLLGVAVLLWMYRIPSRDRPVRRGRISR